MYTCIGIEDGNNYINISINDFKFPRRHSNNFKTNNKNYKKIIQFMITILGLAESLKR